MGSIGSNERKLLPLSRVLEPTDHQIKQIHSQNIHNAVISREFSVLGESHVS